MKALAMIGSGLLVAAALAMPGAAEAQRHGYRGDGYGHRYRANGYRHGYGHARRDGYDHRGYGYDRYRDGRRGCRPGMYYSARRCY